MREPCGKFMGADGSGRGTEDGRARREASWSHLRLSLSSVSLSLGRGTGCDFMGTFCFRMSSDVSGFILCVVQVGQSAPSLYSRDETGPLALGSPTAGPSSL